MISDLGFRIGVIGFFLACAAGFGADAPSLDALQGKWSATRPGREGQTVTLNLEINKDKLTFQISGPDGGVRLFAKGDVTAEKIGSFSVLKLSNIYAGRSAEETEKSGDDRQIIYALRDEGLTLASNFDKVRENEKPDAVTYTRVGKAPTAPAPGAEAKLLGKWNVEVKLGEDTRDYEFQITRADGKLAASVISPRSGEHKARAATFKDDTFTMEVDRDIEGNTVTFVYTGKLAGEELSGTVALKGFEEQFSGKWTAKK